MKYSYRDVVLRGRKESRQGVPFQLKVVKVQGYGEKIGNTGSKEWNRVIQSYAPSLQADFLRDFSSEDKFRRT